MPLMDTIRDDEPKKLLGRDYDRIITPEDAAHLDSFIRQHDNILVMLLSEGCHGCNSLVSQVESDSEYLSNMLRKHDAYSIFINIQDPEFEMPANMMVKRAKEQFRHVMAPVAVPYRKQEIDSAHIRTGMSSILDIGNLVQQAYARRSNGLFAGLRGFYRR